MGTTCSSDTAEPINRQRSTRTTTHPPTAGVSSHPTSGKQSRRTSRSRSTPQLTSPSNATREERQATTPSSTSTGGWPSSRLPVNHDPIVVPASAATSTSVNPLVERQSPPDRQGPSALPTCSPPVVTVPVASNASTSCTPGNIKSAHPTQSAVTPPSMIDGVRTPLEASGRRPSQSTLSGQQVALSLRPPVSTVGSYSAPTSDLRFVGDAFGEDADDGGSTTHDTADDAADASSMLMHQDQVDRADEPISASDPLPEPKPTTGVDDRSRLSFPNPCLSSTAPSVDGHSGRPMLSVYVASLRHSGGFRAVERCWHTSSRTDEDNICVDSVYLWGALWGARSRHTGGAVTVDLDAPSSQDAQLLEHLAALQHSLRRPKPPRQTIAVVSRRLLADAEETPSRLSPISALHDELRSMCTTHEDAHAAWLEFQSYVSRQTTQSAFGMCDMTLRHVPSEVLPGFFVGSYHAVVDGAVLTSLGIGAVVSCLGQLINSTTDPSNDGWGHDGDDGRNESSSPAATYTNHNDVQFCNLELRDLPTYPIQDHFIEATTFLRSMFLENRKRVLVVCGVGVSRAPTIAAAFLCHLFGMDVALALSMLRAVRPQIKPNDAFLLHLMQCYSPHWLPPPVLS